MGIYVDIKTKSGIFRVKKPVGRIGAIHFGIITKYVTGGGEEDSLSPAQREAIGEGFIEWSDKVLPKIFISHTPNGETVAKQDFKVEDITGEDQFAIFTALLSLVEANEGDNFFQVINS